MSCKIKVKFIMNLLIDYPHGKLIIYYKGLLHKLRNAHDNLSDK